MPDHSPPHCVLITVINGERVIDAGSGIVVCHREDGGVSKNYVLTCAHNLKARRVRDVEGLRGKEEGQEAKFDSDILVNGSNAQPIADPDQLEKLDLAVLEAQDKIGAPATWGTRSTRSGLYSAAGFVSFFRQEFVPVNVDSLRCKHIGVVTGRGLPIDYLRLGKQRGGDWFRKGMSGGPVHDSQGKVVAVARMLDTNDEQQNASTGIPRKVGRRLRTAYAIRLTSHVMSLVGQLCNCPLPQPMQRGMTLRAPEKAASPPIPSPPLQNSIEEDDIQKGRWGDAPADEQQHLDKQQK